VTTATAYDGKISHKCEKLRSITATKPKGAVGSRAPSPRRCGRPDWWVWPKNTKPRQTR